MKISEVNVYFVRPRWGFVEVETVLEGHAKKELFLEENKTPHNWKNPVWRHADGSVAEW